MYSDGDGTTSSGGSAVIKPQCDSSRLQEQRRTLRLPHSSRPIPIWDGTERASWRANKPKTRTQLHTWLYSGEIRKRHKGLKWCQVLSKKRLLHTNSNWRLLPTSQDSTFVDRQQTNNELASSQCFRRCLSSNGWSCCCCDAESAANTVNGRRWGWSSRSWQRTAIFSFSGAYHGYHSGLLTLLVSFSGLCRSSKRLRKGIRRQDFR